jgi:hypothetical protein
MAELTVQLKGARRHAVEGAAGCGEQEADAAARRSLGLLARLRMAWRGDGPN